MIIVLKIIGIALLVGVVSIWLGAVISAGVETGLQNYFNKSSKKREVKKK